MGLPPRVTPATRDDYDACARLFAELAVPDPVWPRERFVESVAPDTIVLRSEGGEGGEDEEVVGYAWARPRGDVMHVVHVVVDPRARRSGAGDLLMTALAERARASGLARWMLNVKPDNVAARRLYERHGMHVAFESASVRFSWSDVERLDEAPGMRARPLTIADDAAFEAACGLARGEIASLRDAQGRVALGACDIAGTPLAFAAFDRDFPGLSPVRASASGSARALLAAARPFVHAGQTWLRIFAEGDPALEEALTRAGGQVVLRALRMEGTVP